MEGENGVELEAGFPVAERIPGSGDIVAGELAGGREAVALHVGPFGEVGPVYEALFKWIAEQGLTPAGQPREVYLTDPGAEPDPAKYRTEVICPVR
jgi:effector-binding domain-containing protein